MTLLFLHGCHSPFKGENSFVVPPTYLVDGTQYLRKEDIVVDSVNRLVWNRKEKYVSKKQSDDLFELHNQGKILTTSEFASNITGYYNTLVSVLVGLFILFSIFGYFALNEKFKKELEDKEQELESRLLDIVKDKLSDSKTLQTSIINQIRSEIEDITISKDDMGDIVTDIDKIKADTNTLFELLNENSNQQITGK